MKRRWLTLFTLAVIICLFATGFSPALAGKHDQWTQIPLDAPGNWGILSMETFKDKLYAGTEDLTIGLGIWRLEGDGTWLRVSEYGFGTAELSVPLDMISFNGMLYVGAGDWFGGRPVFGQIWRSADGLTWEPVTTDGFGNPNILEFNLFAAFNDMLYVTTGTITGEMEIWRSASGAPGTWEQVVTAGLMGDTWATATTGLIVFKGALYAVIETDWAHPARVWRSEDGVAWSVVTDNGFGDPYNVSPGGVAILNDYLYVGMHNYDWENGILTSQIWRTKDGWNYEKVMGNSFGDWRNYKVDSLYTFQGQLYAGTFAFDWMNGLYDSGVQIWRSPDGLKWTQVNENGFGDPYNWVTHLSVDVTAYRGSLYYGTLNDSGNGGQVWKLSP